MIASIKHDDELQAAFSLSLPILFAYFPLGIVFGILFFNLGYPWYYAPLMSALVYAGAVQFIALGIFAAHGSYLELILATIFVAFRNAFYGLSVMDRFATHLIKKCYLIFGLVDSTYAILISTPKYNNDERFCLWITFFSHFYWVSGTATGAYFAKSLPNIHGLEFILTSFFMVLVVEQYLSLRTFKPFIIAAIAAIVAAVITPHEFLLTAILLSVTLLLTLPSAELSDGK